MITTRAALQQCRLKVKNPFSSTNVRKLASAVDVDHYASGWTIDDMNQYMPGKFNIKTFNKISPVVSTFNYIYLWKIICCYIFSIEDALEQLAAFSRN